MATAQFTTIVDRAIGDPITEAIWDDQIKDNGNALAGAHRNLLTNGGFEANQRGAGPFTANNAYTADRWQLQIVTGTATVTQETGVVDGSGSALKIVTVGTVNQIITQKLENLTELRGRTLACSVRVQQSVAGAATLKIFDGAGNSASATSATTGAYVTLTTTRAIGAADAGPLFVVVAFSAAGTFYLDNAMLVIGPAPAPYQPLHPAEELARCQRYCEVQGGVNDEFPIISGYANAGAVDRWASLVFAVPKGGIPTATKNGTWGVVNCAQPTISAVTTAGYSIKAVSTAGGEVAAFPNSSDDTLVFEWNP